jgi:hypothetical protein
MQCFCLPPSDRNLRLLAETFSFAMFALAPHLFIDPKLNNNSQLLIIWTSEALEPRRFARESNHAMPGSGESSTAHKSSRVSTLPKQKYKEPSQSQPHEARKKYVRTPRHSRGGLFSMASLYINLGKRKFPFFVYFR